MFYSIVNEVQSDCLIVKDVMGVLVVWVVRKTMTTMMMMTTTIISETLQCSG